MRLLSLALGISLALVSSTAFAATTKYKVHLADTNATDVGNGTFSYDDITKKLTGTVSHGIAKPSGGKLYYKDAKNKDKTIKSYTAGTAKSEVTVDEKLKADEETALTGGNVYFEVYDKTTTGSGQLVPDNGTVDAGADTDAGTDTDAGADTDASIPDPGTDSDSGTDPDPGTDSDSGTNPDPGGGDDTTPGDGSSNSGKGSSNDDGAEEEEEETGGKKGGCAMQGRASTDSFALGAAMAGVLGAAFVARRRRRG